MENNNRRGRPSKGEGTSKREHFSVWVSADQKKQINELIEKSGLSASQFFVTLALDVPFKKPQKRSLPTATADTIRILEQLAGILSLAVLKTKDHQMLSGQWQQSSQRVRLLADLISLWVFEAFEIRSMEKTLAEVHAWLNELTVVLSGLPVVLESRRQHLSESDSYANRIGDLLDKYRTYYLEPISQLEPVWTTMDASGISVHHEIETALSRFLQEIRA